MKKITLIALTVVGSLAFINCSSDDNSGSKQDCFDCTLMGAKAKYCHTEGNDFYTVTVAGQSQKIPLGKASWADTKADLQSICD